jgi:hypothetical protein
MRLQWESVVVNAMNPAALGQWWAAALGWGLVTDIEGDVHIRPTPESHPEILFVAVPEPKQIQNRLHLDFRPDDQQAEVERLLALGARHADVGQGQESWVVLADPEGNEFCVLRSR